MISKLCSYIASFPKDKILHFLLCYIMFDYLLVFSSRLISNIELATLVAFGIMNIIIYGKELYDSTKPNNKFDWHDVIAGYLGIELKFIIFIATL